MWLIGPETHPPRQSCRRRPLPIDPALLESIFDCPSWVDGLDLTIMSYSKPWHSALAKELLLAYYSVSDVDGRSVVQGHENVTVYKLAICYLRRNGDEGVWELPLRNIVKSIPLRCGSDQGVHLST